MKYWAKSKSEETVEDHEQQLLNGLDCLISLYGDRFSEKEKLMIRLAAENHDFGKENYQFQKKMYNFHHEKMPLPNDRRKVLDQLYRNENKLIPHGYLSPSILIPGELKEKYNLNNNEIRIIISAIFWHHDREVYKNNNKLKSIIRDDLQKISEKKLSTAYLSKAQYLLDITNIKGFANWEDIWMQYASVKGMLNRLDYWASSECETEFEQSGKTQSGFLNQIIFKKIAESGWEEKPAQKFMRENSGKSIIVTASTGSGKTEGALMWNGHGKLFYTLPLLVSINAIYQRIINTYQFPESKTALIHSDALSYLLNAEADTPDNEYGENILSKNRTARLFCCPVSVCTIDQLFTFIYKYKGSERLLATLKYSNLVIDEIQAYSPALIGKLIYGLYLINQAGGKFAIMTATLPPVVQYLIDKEVFQISNEDDKPYASFEDYSPIKRHWLELSNRDDFEIDRILEEARTKKVLVLCNTVTKVQEVYRKLADKSDGCYCRILHSRFIQRDRRILEKEILNFAANDRELREPELTDKPGIWVSTQIVEASLDIDFDILFTELSSADSLLQRLGRVWRSREYNLHESNVIVYATANGVSDSYDEECVYDKQIYERTLAYLPKYCSHCLTELEKSEFINSVYDVDSLRNGYYFTTIQKSFQKFKHMLPNVFDKGSALNDFRKISGNTYIPRSIYDEAVSDGSMDSILNRIKGYDLDAIQAINDLQCLTVTVSYPITGSTNYVPNTENLKDRLGEICITDNEYVFMDGQGEGLLNTVQDTSMYAD